MFFKNKLLIGAASLVLAACGGADQSSETASASCEAADTVFHNTLIYVADDANSTAEAVAVKDSKIVFVGSNADAANYMCGDARVIDMAGKFMYPGFTDSHQHLAGIGVRQKNVNLMNITTLAATVKRIEEYAEDVDEGDWILGRGWIESDWTDEQRFLTRHDVDYFSADKPLYIRRADGVSAFANSKAFEIAGITKDTPDPYGGTIERDENGEPTGYLIARAMPLIEKHLPAEDYAYVKDSVERGLKYNASLGWTQTQDAGMYMEELKALKEIQSEGNQLHRVYAAIELSEAWDILNSGRELPEDNMITVRGIKMYIDGTLGSRGAALLENYSDADNSGLITRKKEVLMPVMQEALRKGFQIEIHAIGDRANRVILDWYQEAFDSVSKEEWMEDNPRWRMEHAQIIHPDDQTRFIDLGIIPSMQPSHAIGDLHFAMDRLGPDRISYAYPWKTMVNLGAKVIGGSDSPVEIGDPRIEFYAAVARKDLTGYSGEGWHPELALSRDEALKMFTAWPAYASFREDVLGTVEVGKFADFTVFNKDIMTIPVEEIMESENVMTVVGGNITYEK
ncbi:amidohydrolase [Pseudemcibacter aquimaris]|uniref:amidohydrolase n=1 Tax=Pseudemcibacter aquimaris TaxID=2857064 RepID=UPI002012D15E|nr:amidohydrolase [Pseudemcibacter aquimaris]MCC3861156.1 amidohydrolase [Pseudemcibacter aquimaris]WDU59973.1 amidohydrolase [Pseudemcibacter aquimaris]